MRLLATPEAEPIASSAPLEEKKAAAVPAVDEPKPTFSVPPVEETAPAPQQVIEKDMPSVAALDDIPVAAAAASDAVAAPGGPQLEPPLAEMLELMKSYTSSDQVRGLQQLSEYARTGPSGEALNASVASVWDGLLNCLQDANSNVHEEGLRCLLVIQDCGIGLNAATSAHLLDLLITSLFCSKQPETAAGALRSGRMLLKSHFADTFPVLLKGTICRNLHSALLSLVCISKCLGEEIRADKLSPELMSSMVDQLLRVIATAKV